MTAKTSVAASVALVVVVALSAAIPLAPLPFAVLLIRLGAILPLHRVGAVRDISYGVYIYAWPVQQLLVLALGIRTSVALMIPLVVLITLPLAYLSCRFVEQPALRLKDRGLRPLRVVGTSGALTRSE